MGNVSVVPAPEGVSRETFLNIVAAAYTAWVSNGRGRLPSVEEISSHAGRSKHKVLSVLASPEFKRAIALRGIVWTDEHSGITPEQSAVVSILTNPSDRRDFGKKLKSAGITYHVYRAWMRQPVFKNYIEKVAEDMLQDNISVAHTALTNKAISGDVPALKFFYELTGRYNPAQQEVVQVRAVLNQVLEIIQRRVTDPDTLTAIGNDFAMLAVGGSGITATPTNNIKELEYEDGSDTAPEFTLD